MSSLRLSPISVLPPSPVTTYTAAGTPLAPPEALLLPLLPHQADTLENENSSGAVVDIASKRRNQFVPIPPIPKWLRSEISKISLQESSHGQSLVSLLPTASTSSAASFTDLPAGINDEVAEAVGPRVLQFFHRQFGLDKPIHSLYKRQSASSTRQEHSQRKHLKNAAKAGANVGIQIAQRLRQRRTHGEAVAATITRRGSPTNLKKPSVHARVDTDDTKAPSSGSKADGAASNNSDSPSRGDGPSQASDRKKTSSSLGDIYDNRMSANYKNRKTRYERVQNLDESRRQAREQGRKAIKSMAEHTSLQDQVTPTFERYADGELFPRGRIHCALRDLGLLATTVEEKRSLKQLIDDTIGIGETVAYKDFCELAQMARGTIEDLRHHEVLDWSNRHVGADGAAAEHSIDHLRRCMDALGRFRFSSSAEFDEGIKLSSAFVVKPLYENKAHFNHFVACFHQVQANIIASTRQKERSVAEEYRIPDPLFEEVRLDLVEFLRVFREIDYESVGVVTDEDVMNVMLSYGYQVSESQLSVYIKRAKGQDTAGVITDLQALVSHAEKNSKKSLNLKSHNLDCDFKECLTIVQMIRKRDHAQRSPLLQSIFKLYERRESGHAGVVAIKDLGKLLQHLDCLPRTRQEQAEIQSILLEVDKSGEEALCFEEFEIIVQRIFEGIVKRKRQEEELFATELGISTCRHRELQNLFKEQARRCGGSVLDVAGLRACLDETLGKRLTSEELFDLFEEFCPDSEGMDVTSFLRMIHALEIARTHGTAARARKTEHDGGASWLRREVGSSAGVQVEKRV